ncbi:glycosyltransferase family A protein, partial [Paraclostridium bifermentans]|uniref:glycosyltransferase family A protein n=2 Tax=Paraclostridium TaxID=1849822 RepID=UPI00374F5AE7
MNYKITVFTPTYNRGNMLKNLYEDLKTQLFDSFEWLIVDDGSTDNTKELVELWIEESIIDIRYIYKKNGGKHTAINVGVKNSNGELFFIVDSDDRIFSNTLNTINDVWKHINDDEIKGVVGLCVDNKGEVVGSKLPEKINKTYFSDLYIKHGVTGDKAVVYLTDIMKEYPFPEEDNVKFVMEEVVWANISKKYKVLCMNEPMMIREYLEGGLTKSGLSKKIARGQAFSYLCIINNDVYNIQKNPKLWIKKYVNLYRFSMLCDNSYFK